MRPKIGQRYFQLNYPPGKRRTEEPRRPAAREGSAPRRLAPGGPRRRALRGGRHRRGRLPPSQRSEQGVRGVPADGPARRERDVVVRQGAARVPLAEEGRLGDGRGGAAQGRRDGDAAVPQGQ